jgi:NAD(P)-dependent dehydrogenase (short-subunit alcohol dehydrogenase family)
MKTILMTGAGSGLGRGAAIGLAQAGHNVIAATQLWPQLTELRRHVEELGLQDRVTVDKLDILDLRDIDAAVTWVRHVRRQCRDRRLRTDGRDPGRTRTPHVRDQRLLQPRADPARRPQVQRRRYRRRVVIVSSMGGLLTAYGLGSYCASKHAVEAIAVWPPSIEDLIKQVQQDAWTRSLPTTVSSTRDHRSSTPRP